MQHYDPDFGGMVTAMHARMYLLGITSHNIVEDVEDPIGSRINPRKPVAN